MSDDEQVRRLLAEARHDEPVPDDVAARLDEVLAELRDDKRPTAPVDLAARRRRRHVRNGLLAAAAVVVVGIGLNQVDLSATDDATSGGDSAAGSQSEAGPREQERPSAAAPDADAASGTDWQRARLDLTSDRFGDEVSDFRQRAGHLKRYTLNSTELGGLASSADGASAVCQVGRLGRGHRVPVRYDGERAWLVFRPVQGETQVVDLYLCGADAPARSITLPSS